MKRKMNALIWSLCAVVALGGCAVSKKSDTGNADTDTDTILKGDAGETADPADTAEAFSAEAGSSNTADTSDARDLTTAELQKFTDWINEGDNGGTMAFCYRITGIRRMLIWGKSFIRARAWPQSR